MAKVSKVASVWNHSAIVEAAVAGAQANGAFVNAILTAREPLKGAPTDAMIAACAIDMAAEFKDNGLSKGSLEVYLSSARLLMACSYKTLLSACEEGFGITGVCKRVRAAAVAAGAPAKAVRGPNKVAGKAGKAGKAGAAAAPAANDNIIPKDGGASPLHRWNVALSAMLAGATIVRNADNKTLSAEDAVVLQQSVTALQALIGKYL